MKKNKLKYKIGANLFKVRQERDLPLDSVAKMLSMHKSKLDRLERGHGCMNVCNLERLAEIYKINIGDLFR